MSELQPPELSVNPEGGGGGVGAGGGGSSENMSSAQGIGYSKRQRRPSVRLGDIGDQPATLSYDSHLRRKDTGGKSSKPRPLSNFGNGDDNSNETLENDNSNFDLLSIRRAKRGGGGGSKRVRSNWVSKPADADAGRDEGQQGFRDPEDLPQSPLKDHIPVHSPDFPQNLDHESDKEGLRINRGEELELDGPSEWKGGTSTDGNDKSRFWDLQDGVRTWLNGLGLGKYAPVFEIHEVDEDVLPQLTLEDLKDMGINAVGSRRKLYSAIQKLAKGFS